MLVDHLHDVKITKIFPRNLDLITPHQVASPEDVAPVEAEYQKYKLIKRQLKNMVKSQADTVRGSIFEIGSLRWSNRRRLLKPPSPPSGRVE